MNIHFSELLIVFLIALLVIKPERLPEVARMLGRLIKQGRQTLAKIKKEIGQHESEL